MHQFQKSIVYLHREKQLHTEQVMNLPNLLRAFFMP